MGPLVLKRTIGPGQSQILKRTKITAAGDLQKNKSGTVRSPGVFVLKVFWCTTRPFPSEKSSLGRYSCFLLRIDYIRMLFVQVCSVCAVA